MRRLTRTTTELTETERARGMRLLMVDGVTSLVMLSLTTGPFLSEYAIGLGATNLLIGVMAAAQPLSLALNPAASMVVDAVGKRRATVVVTALVARLLWLVTACAALWAPAEWRLELFVGCLLAYYTLGALTTCAWNSWMKDLIPSRVMGRFFGDRMALATVVAAVVTLGAGFMLEMTRVDGGNGVGVGEGVGEGVGGYAWWVYPGVFAVAGVSGLAGVVVLSMVAEPAARKKTRREIAGSLLKPVRDREYRRVLAATWVLYAGVWLVQPFVSVVELTALGKGIGLVTTLQVVTQVVSAAFFRMWGRHADEVGNRAVLVESGVLVGACAVVMPLAGTPGAHELTTALLIVAHVVMGMGVSGVQLCCYNLALRRSPEESATSYMAAYCLAAGSASTLSPLVAGAIGDALARTGATAGVWAGDAVGWWWRVVSGLDWVFLGGAVMSAAGIVLVSRVKEADAGGGPGKGRGEVRFKVIPRVAWLAAILEPGVVVREGGKTKRRRRRDRRERDAASEGDEGSGV